MLNAPSRQVWRRALHVWDPPQSSGEINVEAEVRREAVEHARRAAADAAAAAAANAAAAGAATGCASRMGLGAAVGTHELVPRRGGGGAAGAASHPDAPVSDALFAAFEADDDL